MTSTHAGIAFFSCLILITHASTPAATIPEDSLRTAPARVSPVQRMIERTSAVGSPGHARAIPGSAHFLGPDILAGQDQGFIDINRLLLRIPGVYVVGEDGYGLRPNIGMRGVAPYRSAGIAFLEDGVPASPAPYAAPGLPAFAGLGRTGSIETLKGPGTLRHGPQTSGGVVNLLSIAPPEDLAVSTHLSLGSDNARSLGFGYGDSRKSASWLFATHHTQTDGFKVLDGGGNTGFDHDDYLVKLRFRSAPGVKRYQETLFKFGRFETTAHDSYLGLTDVDFAVTPLRRYAASQKDLMRHDGTQVMIRHFVALTDAVDVTTTVYRNDLDLDWYLLDRVNGVSPAEVLRAPSFFAEEYAILAGDSASAADALIVKSNHRGYFAQGIQSIAGFGISDFGSLQQIEVGVRYHEDEEDRLHRNDGYRMESNGMMRLTSTGRDGGQGGLDNQVNEARSVAVFVRDRFAGETWAFVPGVRVEHVAATQSTYGPGDAGRSGTASRSEESSTSVLPGAGGAFRVTPGVTVLAGIHAGIAPRGAGTSRVERSIHYEAGARARHANVDGALIGFRTEHMVFPSDFASAWGLEASTGWSIHNPLYGIEVGAAYTFTRAEYAPRTVEVDNGIGTVDDIPYVPEHSASAWLGLSTKRSFAGMFVNYASRTRTVPGSGPFPASTSAAGHVLADVVTEYEVFRRVRVFTSVYNLTDEIHVASRFSYGAHPRAPRTFTAGLKLDL